MAGRAYKRLEWSYPDTGQDQGEVYETDPPGEGLVPMWPPSPVPPDYVNTASIQDGAVTEPKLADQSVSNRTIVDFSVTTDKIGTEQVIGDKLADNSVTTPRILDEAVTEPKLADNAVSTRTIAPFTVGVSQIDNDFLDRILATGPQSAVGDFSGNAIGNAMSTTQGNVILNILRTAGIIET